MQPIRYWYLQAPAQAGQAQLDPGPLSSPRGWANVLLVVLQRELV
eukprot:COSAG04_NODE_1185_length_7876_cov_15.856629_8_plen_45_part_00